MNPAIDPSRARDVFVAALRTSPDQREAYLSDACAGDEVLRRRVKELLAAHEQGGSFLASPAAGETDVGLGLTADQPAPATPVGSVVGGRYRLLERIGEGGFGVVFMAEQTAPVQRRVALKIIKPGMDSGQVIARFEAERQALALMDHPNIAKVFDAGVTETGRPFFVMELVKGTPITKYCDEHRLPPRQRLELFIQVCQAVQHAHQKGIIHRDLKPTNVLVAQYDGKPVHKVIDFGVAKATGQRLTDATMFTGLGDVIGTPQYMSPEQAELNQLDVDTRSDIYSLGVLLYELLTGTTPLESKRVKEAALLEVLRVIREEEPPRPSTRLTATAELPSIAAQRGLEPRSLSGIVRGELDWIVMKALEKDRSRRYETANGLARDIERYMTDEPVTACPPSTAYRLKKFVRRNRGPVLAATLLALALVAGIVGTAFGMVRAEKRRVEAEQARDAEAAAKRKAEQAEAQTLEEFRASTDDAIEQLISSKPELGPQEKAYLEKTLKRWQVFADRQGDDERSMAVRAAGLFRVALLWHKLGERDAARKGYEAARDLSKSLVSRHPDVPEYQLNLALDHNQLGILLRGLGEGDTARKEYKAALDLLKPLKTRFSDAPVYQHDLGRTHNNLGVLLNDLGERDAARKEFEAARDLQKPLTERYPADPKYQKALAGTHHNLGALLNKLSERDAARKEFEAARDLLKSLTARFPDVPEYKDSLAATRHGLGVLLAGVGESETALKEFEAGRDLLKSLHSRYPAVPNYQATLATAHHNLGVFLRGLGERDAARKEYEAARDLQKPLTERPSAIPAHQQDLALTQYNLGILLRDLGDWGAARKEFEAARDLQTSLTTRYRDVPQYKESLAATHCAMGGLLNNLEERDAARKEYQAARDLQKELVDRYPLVPAYRIGLGEIYSDFGILVATDGQPAESLKWFDMAIATLEPVHRADPRDVAARQALVNSHRNRAIALSSLKKYAEAVKDLDRAIELSPAAAQPQFRALRAAAKVNAGMIAEAVAEVSELTKSSGWTADQWYNFACVYGVAGGKVADKKQEYADRAMELLHEAVKAGFKNVAHMKKDTDLDILRERDDFKKLVAELEVTNKRK
jgi:eukaryotic-like serine/threonine-protein kinase